MYVEPRARGRGIAQAVVQRLETIAWDRGYATVLLESGIFQPEACALYERVGYVRRGSYGEYVDNEYSVFFEKQLK